MELIHKLTDTTVQPKVVADCCTLVDEEVKAKGGLSGVAIKTGYKATRNIRPGLIEEAVRKLLPDFAHSLEPMYQAARSASSTHARYFDQHADHVADALLGITDRKINEAQSSLVRATYQKLRPMAKRHVQDAVPRIGQLIDKYDV